MTEQLAYVAQQGADEFRALLMVLCLIGLSGAALALVVVKVAAPAWRFLRKYLSLPAVECVFVAGLVGGLIHYGATKSVTFDGGIKQNPLQKSVVSNATVSIHWTRDTTRVIVPLSAPVYIDYRQCGATNNPWANLGEGIVSDYGWSGTLANATNYDYLVWAYYIPPEPVHTNGVWLYKTLKDRNDKYALPLRSVIRVNGKVISTPAAKRKEEE